jgi:hypothetical protein
VCQPSHNELVRSRASAPAWIRSWRAIASRVGVSRFTWSIAQKPELGWGWDAWRRVTVEIDRLGFARP